MDYYMKKLSLIDEKRLLALFYIKPLLSHIYGEYKSKWDKKILNFKNYFKI